MNTPQTKSWKYKFQCLLNTIGDELTTDDVDSMKFLLKQSLPGSALEKAKDPKDIFLLMQKSELLSYEKTTTLTDLLREIKRPDQATKLRELDKSLHESKSVPYNIKHEKLVSHFQKTQISTQLKKRMAKEKLVILSGPLGAGKSQNALWFGIKVQRKNSNSVVWHCNARDRGDLLTSLRCLAEELSISTQTQLWTETEYEENTFLVCGALQKQLLSRKVDPFYHLIIIDDVADECTETVQNLVKCFLSTKECNTKFIITTRNKFILPDFEAFEVNGFTREESLDFLMNVDDKSNEEKRKQYQKLADVMSNLPLGLYTAKTYMKNMMIGPLSFVKLLKKENLESIDKQIKAMHLQSNEITLFTAIKFCIYDDLRQNISPEGFEMFQMIQFLENDEIPIILLEYVFREGDQTDTMLLSNFLVQAVQKRSLGIIGGEDENRLLSIHGVVATTLDMCTPVDEKIKLLKKLIWGLALLLDKDVFHYNDLKRLKLLTPHARAVLKHAEKLEIARDKEVSILMIFVYDLVGYGYNYGRFVMITTEYNDKAKELCFRLIAMEEKKNDEDIANAISPLNENDISFYSEFAQKKADIIFNQLDVAVSSHSDILTKLVPRFVLHRFRVQQNIEMIANFLDEDSSIDFNITEETYKKLVNKGLAIPDKVMNNYFLHELFLSVFYTFGRQIFYRGSNIKVEDARKFLRYLYLAKELGNKLSIIQENLPPLNAILAEITGILPTCFDDFAKVIPNKIEVLQKVAERAETLFSLKGKYHVFGIVKMDASSSNHFQTNCLKLALRCFTTMLNMEEDEGKKQEIYEKGSKLAEEILERAKEIRDRRDLPGYNVRVAEFYISYKNISQDKICKAEKLFESAFPKEFFEKDFSERIPTRHELSAGYGLIKCYLLSDRKDLAARLSDKLKSISF